MNQAPRFIRRARWAVPFGAVAAVGVVVAGSVLTSAQAAPSLQARTPAQLIAAIAANKSWPASLSGTIVANSALGLPDLPGTGDSMSAASLLTGSHTIKIWYARPGQLRLALPVPLGETDLRVDGRQVWLWDSQTNTATHVVRPAGPVGGLPAPLPSGSRSSSGKPHSSAWFSSSGTGRGSTTSESSGSAYQSTLAVSSLTPQQMARQLLAAIGPTTTVSVQSNIVIAGRAAYQLVLAPKNPGSLIGRVAIAVDASRYIPLRVQVFARGAASPAFQVGYTSISLARPAASNFAFTPPPGAKVKTVRPPVGPLAGFRPGALPGNNGGGFIGMQRQLIIRHGKIIRLKGNQKAIAKLLPTRRRVRAVPLPTGSLTMSPARAAMRSIRIGTPKHLSKSQRQHLLKMLRNDMARARRAHPGIYQNRAGWYAFAPGTGRTFPPGLAAAPRVIGSGWTAVGVFPAPALTGQAGGEAGALLRSATAVHGSWGSGRLLRTSLLSVLITSDGRALIGAVTPSVLYAAAAQAK
jgi:outer membrane lipoprotein-sorting protein